MGKLFTRKSLFAGLQIKSRSLLTVQDAIASIFYYGNVCSEGANPLKDKILNKELLNNKISDPLSITFAVLMFKGTFTPLLSLRFSTFLHFRCVQPCFAPFQKVLPLYVHVCHLLSLFTILVEAVSPTASPQKNGIN